MLVTLIIIQMTMLQAKSWLKTLRGILLLESLVRIFFGPLLLDDDEPAFPYACDNWLPEMHFHRHTFRSAW